MATNENKFTVPSVSSSDLETLSTALGLILEVVGSGAFAEDGKEIKGDAATLKVGEMRAAFERAATVLANERGKEEREQKIADRKVVAPVFYAAVQARIEAYREIAKLPATTRALLGSVGESPKEATVKLGDLAPLFPGVQPENLVKRLHEAGVKFAKGNHKSALDRPVVIGISEKMLKSVLAGEETNANDVL